MEDELRTELRRMADRGAELEELRRTIDSHRGALGAVDKTKLTVYAWALWRLNGSVEREVG